MMALRYNRKSLGSFKNLVKSYPPEEFNSPFRSTVPHLCLWRDHEQFIVSFCQALDIIPPAHFQASFEYQVAPARGRGKASHTDIMLEWDDTVVTIEAKYTEPPYQTVRKWLGVGNSNKRLVLEGWRELISHAAVRSIRPDDVLNLSYQLIHRCASACHLDARTRYVVYVLFDDGSRKLNEDYYLDQFKSIDYLLGHSPGLKLALIRIPFRPKPAYLDLQKEWTGGGRSLRAAVIDGLLKDTLMEFDGFQPLWIS